MIIVKKLWLQEEIWISVEERNNDFPYFFETHLGYFGITSNNKYLFDDKSTSYAQLEKLSAGFGIITPKNQTFFYERDSLSNTRSEDDLN